MKTGLRQNNIAALRRGGPEEDAMTLLLVIIYLAFISLGLPDALLGSAWPAMYGGLGVPIDSAGMVTVVVTLGTVVSSLLSDRANRRFGTGPVTFASVCMTALALMGISFASHFWMLCLWAVPLGLGAGSVDAALNNFVALHYKANHMSWLHCFWGVGASLGPIIMSYYLLRRGAWSGGYRLISILQFVLVAVLLASLPLWKKARVAAGNDGKPTKNRLSTRQLAALPGAKQALLACFFYCATELTVGLWGSTYLVTIRGLAVETAASWVSLYYIGITFGRFLSGFLAIKLRHKQMVQLGQAVVGCGIVVLLLPVGGYLLLAGLFLIGLGLAPIYPSLLHETPLTFGSEHSQAMMGLQMACAYVGNSFVPPLFGLLAAQFGYGLLPVFMAILLLGMVLAVVRLYQVTAARRAQQ